MSSRLSSSKPQGASKCRYTTSALSKRAATLQKGLTRGTMADDENTKTQAEEDRLLMPPPPRPATRRTRSSPRKASTQKTAEFTMKLRPRKSKSNGKSEHVATAAATDTDTDTKPEDDTKESEDDTKNSDGDTKKPEDEDLPPIKPLNRRERLLFPGIMPTFSWLFETMTPEEVELWRELAPQAGDGMLTVAEVDKLCEEFYKESRD